MEKEFRNWELIQSYLDGSLGEQELLAFEARLEAEPDLRAELEMERAADNAVRLAGMAERKKKLKAVHQNMLAEQERQRQGVKRRWMAMAAGILLLLVPAIYFLFLQDGQNQQLFDEHFRPFPDLITEKGPEMDPDLKQAMQLYANGEYEEAIPLFDAVPETTALKTEARFYAGISYLAMEEAVQAEKELLVVAGESGNRFAVDAKWYLGLSYLLQDRKQDAQEVFQEVSPFVPDAASILRALEE